MKNDKRMTKYKMAAGCLKNCIGPISTKKEIYIYEEVITTTLIHVSTFGPRFFNPNMLINKHVGLY